MLYQVGDTIRYETRGHGIVACEVLEVRFQRFEEPTYRVEPIGYFPETHDFSVILRESDIIFEEEHKIEVIQVVEFF